MTEKCLFYILSTADICDKNEFLKDNLEHVYHIKTSHPKTIVKMVY